MVTSPKYITNAEGKPIEVILPLQDYRNLLEQMDILRARAVRENLLALPPEARIKLLKQQAAMVGFYEQDTAWRELDAVDDFYAYQDE